ncbi:hypothetical protein BDZ90DRAFT_278368 [Jaminaea rosea]|uniref:Plus3 domain-containing protein n=1 Tax=Jaminaea rosea TaxID=1569628 RepID=A0A316UVZ2_9BASI|nr:hypothetical protein BDZ90DRAFT_278368 [Jaminaea rosea]PWN28968.1 hypothetical protein BDZ90DRAFT_278368 [Jaminaea rosea]
MASNLDDELLALAGGGASSDEDEAKTASKRRSKSASASKSSSKKRKVHNSDDDDDDEADAPAYPLEGLYKDEADKAYVESLPYIEREELIAGRRDEQAARARKAQLAGMVAAQQGQASRTKKKAATKKKTLRRKKPAADSDMDEGDSEEDDEDDDEDEDEDSDNEATTSGRKGARVRKSVGTSETRNRKLQELSENRKKKAAKSRARAAARGDDDDDDDDDAGGRRGRKASTDSDEESEESSGYVDSDEERGLRTGRLKGRTAQRSRRTADDGPFIPPDLDDINRARIGRDSITRIMYLKNWEDKLIGQFVRVNMGPQRDERTGKTVQRYRAYEVVDWKNGSRWYKVDEGKYTNVLVVLQFAKEKHERDLAILSNSPITPEEFERYEQAAKAAPNRPSKRQVLDQAEEWGDFMDYVWTEADYDLVLKAKKEARRAYDEQVAGRNPGAAGRASSPSTINGNGRPAAGSSNLTAAEAAAKSENELLADLNERNRKADRQRILEAERKQAEQRRKAAMAAAAAQRQREAAEKVAEGGSTNGSGTGTPASTAPTAVGTSGAKSSAADGDFDLGDF